MTHRKPFVFLGGTCGDNAWRERFIEAWTRKGLSAALLFDPVVEHWDRTAQEREERMKREAEWLLFYIARPYGDSGLLSAYSMVEATMALFDNPMRTVVLFDASGYKTEGREVEARASLLQSERVLRTRFPHHRIMHSLDGVVEFLSDQYTRMKL